MIALVLSTGIVAQIIQSIWHRSAKSLCQSTIGILLVLCLAAAAPCNPYFGSTLQDLLATPLVFFLMIALATLVAIYNNQPKLLIGIYGVLTFFAIDLMGNHALWSIVQMYVPFITEYVLPLFMIPAALIAQAYAHVRLKRVTETNALFVISLMALDTGSLLKVLWQAGPLVLINEINVYAVACILTTIAGSIVLWQIAQQWLDAPTIRTRKSR